jgi:hypothetical protein
MGVDGWLEAWIAAKHFEHALERAGGRTPRPCHPVSRVNLGNPHCERSPAPLDPLLHTQYVRAPMKTVAQKSNRKAAAKARPRMTRELAEARAVGDPSKPKFDGVAFLRSLKK